MEGKSILAETGQVLNRGTSEVIVMAHTRDVSHGAWLTSSTNTPTWLKNLVARTTGPLNYPPPDREAADQLEKDTSRRSRISARPASHASRITPASTRGWRAQASRGPARMATVTLDFAGTRSTARSTAGAMRRSSWTWPLNSAANEASWMREWKPAAKGCCMLQFLPLNRTTKPRRTRIGAGPHDEEVNQDNDSDAREQGESSPDFLENMAET
ncbi:hypothetical protein B0H63DRAFT_456186 [Podospora didyma]|uniref:Uncharacterized protein n=1 Tax=Podospora didyma TaxID=330526 RepID=A0AAE0JY35_9PEZI|nr:hypothetical protein B0H63DRAFT_456186 [Podospora didyma]